MSQQETDDGNIEGVINPLFSFYSKPGEEHFLLIFMINVIEGD